MPETVSVLVVEDSTTQRAQITRVLEVAGFMVTGVGEASEAINRLEETNPQAFVLDIVMPGMNGFELCARIRTEGRFDSVPIILLTSLSDSSDVLRGLECGADSFVVKPCDDDYLPRLIRTLLDPDATKFHSSPGAPIRFGYKGQEFVVGSDYERMLKLLVSSFESAGELNRRLADAHAQLSTQAALLKRKVNAQAFQIDQQVEERRNVESQLYHYQRMEAVDRLAGAVAHDFNNMLMVIQGFTDFLLKDTPEDDKRYKSLSEIRKASDRAAELTEQLLIFSRKQEFTEEDFDLNRLVSDIHSMLSSILGDDVRLEYKLTSELLPVRLDKGQIEQVVVNLATNARDAMPDGGSCVFESNLHAVEPGSPEEEQGVTAGAYARLEVTDAGSGMPRDVLEHIFEPFYTTKDKGKGTGLGLSTVFGVVRKSGGYILCSSQPGVGTCFSLYFPLAGSAVEGEHE